MVESGGVVGYLREMKLGLHDRKPPLDGTLHEGGGLDGHMLDRLISRLRRTSSTALNHRDNSVTGEGHRVSVRHHDEQVGRSINKIDKNDNSTGKTRQNNHVGESPIMKWGAWDACLRKGRKNDCLAKMGRGMKG